MTADLPQRLRAHVDRLASEIGERNVWHPAGLAAAVAYLRDRFRAGGLVVREQSYECRGIAVCNVEATLPGTRLHDEVVLVGAHYDSVAGTVGANDNGSGVAGMLEIARHLAEAPAARRLRFVAFVNEEPPFFRTRMMGSLVYAREARRNRDDIKGMLSLETIGYYDDTPGSQRYPLPMGALYPDTGNFIGFVGNLRSAGLVRSAVSAFRRHSPFPAESAALPGWVPGVGWSDQWSFWRNGYRAIMVTDTAPFRYPWYHTSADTPGRIDYPRMAQVVSGLTATVRELADA